MPSACDRNNIDGLSSRVFLYIILLYRIFIIKFNLFIFLLSPTFDVIAFRDLFLLWQEDKTSVFQRKSKSKKRVIPYIILSYFLLHF